MIASMTGFARRERTGSFGTLVCEIRSVNHRFLDATLRLPDELPRAGTRAAPGARRTLRRGKVDCTLQQRAAQAGGSELDIDRQALGRLLARVRNCARACRILARVDPIELLRWPGIFAARTTEHEVLAAACRELFAATLAELAARARA